jgi:hypothetical protein
LKNGWLIPHREARVPVSRFEAGIPAVPAPVTEVPNPCTKIELRLEAEESSEPVPSTLIPTGYPVTTALFNVNFPFLLMWIPFS